MNAILLAALGLGMDALAYGMALFIISVGLSVTVGLMRVVNLAHGAFAMIGGYLAAHAAGALGLPYGLAVLGAVAGAALVGLLLERILIRRLYGGRDVLEQVLLTIGIAFVVIGVANALFGPTLKSITLPDLLRGPVDLGFRTLAAHRLFVIGAGAGLALALWLFLERTRFGLRLRACTDNAAMAAALGIRTATVYRTAFAVAAGLGALGGVLGAEMLPIEPYYALRYMMTFLVVVCVGGAGSITGALAASLLLGAVDTLGKYWVPDFGDFFFYVAVIVTVLLFPNGLTGRAA